MKFSSPLLDALETVRAKYDCNCVSTEVRVRTHKDHSRHFVLQCIKCGKVGNKAIPEAKALEITGGQQPMSVEPEKWKTWNAEKRKEIDEVSAAARNIADSEYDRYLASPEWSVKRQLVLKRAGGLCEGCGCAAATDVHHLTYDNRYHEFLFELVAVCRPCHERIHQNPVPPSALKT